MGRLVFVPQVAYAPLGSLRSALLYPGSKEEQECFSDAQLRAVLAAVGLGTLAEKLYQDQDWSGRLSLAEQQRLAFARLLLIKPAVALLDEATSALDSRAESQLYGLLRTAGEGCTVVSTSHRTAALCSFHEQTLD